MQIFPRCLGILKDGLIQKFFVVFPQWTGFEIWIFCGFPRFLGDPKNSWKADFSAISWDFEGWARPKTFRTRTSLQFSWDFEGTDPPKKIVDPQTYPRFSWDFEGTDPPKKLSHWTANPATVRCKKHSQIASWDLSILDGFFLIPQTHPAFTDTL